MEISFPATVMAYEVMRRRFHPMMMRRSDGKYRHRQAMEISLPATVAGYTVARRGLLGKS